MGVHGELKFADGATQSQTLVRPLLAAGKARAIATD
jgi:hypothetical protein